MDDKTILIELDAIAIREVRNLMRDFNVDRVDEMIAIAVGVLRTLQNFEQDGVVTVVDPRAASSVPADREVELVFETLRSRARRREPAGLDT